MSNSPVSSVPAHSCLRVLLLPSFSPSSLPTPERGESAERPETSSLVEVAQYRATPRLRGMGPPAQPGGTPHGAPPWRCRPRSHLRPRCRVRREGSTPPAAMGWLRAGLFVSAVYQPRSTPHPAPPSGSPREALLMSGMLGRSISPRRSQYYIHHVFVISVSGCRCARIEDEAPGHVAAKPQR